MGRNGFSLNFLTSFSEGASWCFLPVSLFTANSLFNWGMRVVMVNVKKAIKIHSCVTFRGASKKKSKLGFCPNRLGLGQTPPQQWARMRTY